ncbi:MAG TPA: ATP-binding protein [Chthoniobacterales bacterium]|nr:ATP-binding protein [Chthoniobacterales bacterium]
MKNGNTKLRSRASTNGHAKPRDLALRTSELRYRRLFESAQDGILILDGETGEIIDVNPFLLDLLNYHFADMVGLKLWEIGQFKDIAANRESFEKLQKNQYIRYEDLPLVTKDGKKIQVEFVSNVYLVDGQHIIQCNIRDISARAKVQEVSRTHLTALLVENKTKDEFLAALSHELRTPLSAISSMLDVLELQQSLANMSDAQTPTELDRSGLKLVRRNVHILVSLINELLDLTHISRGDIHLELATIDAHHAIGDALRDVVTQLKAKRIDLRVNLRAEFRHIKADNSKFHRIITNLINNAIKFTPVDGKIRVVTTNAPPNDDLIIEIFDSGIGIDSESLARIFSPFEQGDTSVRRRFGGLGLGLSISKSLAEAHGATLEAESGGKDNGSTFRLRFKTEQIFPGELVLMSQPILVTSMRVLLVEDHADTRECLHRLLESGGHMVRSAEDARSAIAWSEREKFDLLVADVSLPDRSGLELLLELRERDPRLLAIALSGYGMPQDFVDSKEAGFVEHFVKPVDMPKLHATINRLATRKAFE